MAECGEQRQMDLAQPLPATPTYELEDAVIYWPKSSDELHQLINFSFGDCWQAREQGVPKSVYRLKVLHLGLWSIAELFPCLGNMMMDGRLSTPNIRVVTNEDILATLAISASNTVDTPLDKIYRALTALCLVSKQPVCYGKFIAKWSSRRFTALLGSLYRDKNLATQVMLAPRDAAILHHFFRHETNLRGHLVISVLEQLSEMQEHNLFRAFRRHLDHVWQWSGLTVSRIMNDLCSLNTSVVWKLPKMEEEASRFRELYKCYMTENEDLAPYGRLLNLPLVDTIKNEQFPNLYLATCVHERLIHPDTFKYVRISQVEASSTVADIQKALTTFDQEHFKAERLNFRLLF